MNIDHCRALPIDLNIESSVQLFTSPSWNKLVTQLVVGSTHPLYFSLTMVGLLLKKAAGLPYVRGISSENRFALCRHFTEEES